MKIIVNYLIIILVDLVNNLLKQFVDKNFIYWLKIAELKVVKILEICYDFTFSTGGVNH